MAGVRNTPRLTLGRGARNGRAAFRGKRFVLIASRFNERVTRALVEAALRTLARHGVSRRNVQTVWVPGAFELPVTAAVVAARLRPHAIVALGCVVKGQTPQYAALGHAVTDGLAQASVQVRVPVTLGVIIADSGAQARARAGGSMGNRGSEATLAALAMVELLGRLSRRP